MTPHDIAWYEAELDKGYEEIQRLTDILDAIRVDCERQTRIHGNSVPFSYTDGLRDQAQWLQDMNRQTSPEIETERLVADLHADLSLWEAL